MAACVLIYCLIAQGTFSWAALMVQQGPSCHKLRGLLENAASSAWPAMTLLVKTEGRDENLRILVSGRDPRSRDESNGQRPQLLPDGLGQSVGGWVGGRLGSQK